MNYLECLGRSFPNVYVTCSGDPENYNDLVWVGEEGDQPLPSEEELIAQDLANRQSDKWYEIERERDRREADGGTKVVIGEDVYWFHSDESSKIKQISFAFMSLLSHLGLIEQYPPIPWRLMTKDFVPMTAPLAMAVFCSAVHNTSEIFRVAHAHRMAMMQRTDPSSYDYSSGWPEMFSDNHPGVPV